MVSGGLIYGRAVPVKAEPLQVVHDEVGRSGDDTWFVDVFDAQVDCVVAAVRKAMHPASRRCCRCACGLTASERNGLASYLLEWLVIQDSTFSSGKEAIHIRGEMG